MRPFPETVRMVAFDLDGTLVDAYPAIRDSLNHMLASFNLPPRSLTTVKRAVGWGVDNLVENFVGKELREKGLEIFRAHHDQRLRRDIRLLPGARRILTFLRRNNCRLAVASNRPTEFCHIILKNLKIAHYFSDVRGGDSVPVAKPDPEILKRVLARAKVPSCEMIYIGDMTVDILCGRRAGVMTVAVPTGSCTLAQLRAGKPDRIVRDLDELRSLLVSRRERFPGAF